MFYTGKETACWRRKLAIEAEWFNYTDKVLKLDEHFLDLAKNAFSQGRKILTLGDLGSGFKGTFINQLTTDRNSFPQLSAFLDAYEDFSVRCIGVTAVFNPYKQGELIEEKESTAFAGGRIFAENYAYTVSRSKTIGTFMGRFGNFDAWLATWSLPYFTPQNFKTVVLDMSRSLVRGGSLHAVPYHDKIPSGYEIAGGDKIVLSVNTQESIFSYKDPYLMTKDERIYILSGLVAFSLRTGIFSVNTLKKYIGSTLFKYRWAENANTREEFLREVTEMVANSSDEVFDRIYDTIFHFIDDKVYSRAEAKTHGAKKRTLEQVSKDNELDVWFNDNAFLIRKK